MPEVRWVLNRHPWILAVLILVGLGAAMGAVTNYIHHTIRPQQRAALEARIADAVHRAEGRYEGGKFARALEDYQHVQRTFDADLTRESKGQIAEQVGLCYLGLADQGDPQGHLAQAVAAFQEALEFFPVNVFATAHASVQSHLGDAYRRHFQVEARSELADKAIEAYQAALRLHAADSDSVAQAQTLNRLGNVHRDLHQAGNSSMEQALQFYEQARAALVAAPDAATLGATYTNTGLAYLILVRGNGSSRNLKRAIDQFDRAVNQLDAETSPREYGTVHKYLGDAYTLLADAKPGTSTNRALHTQNVIAYRNKAKAAYKIAENFGIRRQRPAPAEKK